MTVEAIATLLGAASAILVALAGLVASVASLIGAFRKKDTAPAPQLGITATAPAEDDDIDYRAYQDMRADRDMWRARALRDAAHIDEDTQPLDPT